MFNDLSDVLWENVDHVMHDYTILYMTEKDIVDLLKMI